jgi:hypothetical protein
VVELRTTPIFLFLRCITALAMASLCGLLHQFLPKVYLSTLRYLIPSAMGHVLIAVWTNPLSVLNTLLSLLSNDHLIASSGIEWQETKTFPFQS